MKNSELQNKGVITSLAVQQQIAAGNAEAMVGASRVAHLEGELAEAKVSQGLGNGYCLVLLYAPLNSFK